MKKLPLILLTVFLMSCGGPGGGGSDSPTSPSSSSSDGYSGTWSYSTTTVDAVDPLTDSITLSLTTSDGINYSGSIKFTSQSQQGDKIVTSTVTADLAGSCYQVNDVYSCYNGTTDGWVSLSGSNIQGATLLTGSVWLAEPSDTSTKLMSLWTISGGSQSGIYNHSLYR